MELGPRDLVHSHVSNSLRLLEDCGKSARVLREPLQRYRRTHYAQQCHCKCRRRQRHTEHIVNQNGVGTTWVAAMDQPWYIIY